MSARPILYLLFASSVGCVSYDRNDAKPEAIAAAVAARAGGTFSVDEAIELALRQNPTLRAAEANARDAGAATLVPLTALVQWRGRNRTIEASLDPIALLGLGQRGAAIATAEARQLEATATLATLRWRTIAAVVEEFLVDAALNNLQVEDLQLDVDAFVSAGLASRVAAQQLLAAQARALSEQAELQRARQINQARLRELLGLPASAELLLAEIDQQWLLQPDGTDQQLLSRPDLALAAARFEVADASFYQAVTDQYPALQVGPNISLMGDPMRAMAMLQIPIGMHGLAEAARERREAAPADTETAFLQARREATNSDAQLAAANAVASATAAAVQANIAALRSARAALEVEVDAFAQVANIAGMVVRETMEHRIAAITKARAIAQRAVAYGWPRTANNSEQL